MLKHGVYAPSLQADLVEKDQFYTDLLHLTQKVPTDDKIIILGDFNTRVEAAELLGLEVILKKTEVLYQLAPQEVFHHPHITIGESELKSVQQFIDLGSIISSDATGYQLFQQYAVGDSVKGLAEVQIDHIHNLTLIHQAGHLIIKGYQVGQTGPALPKSMLAGSEPFPILKMLCDRTQDDLLHNPARHRGQADRPVVTWINLTALFVDWGDIRQLPIIWDLLKESGLLVDDEECLCNLFCQLPHHPRVDPIWSHRPVRIQVF
ncbi:hypothetical protein WISP_04707 [Willisornis vidua]|uniref:Endonuclease/exonuclease/phosphatase domain-containing protein n=1 Tax=Willisornis vidua TaxID=1566151 RepID=A0ABQ9DZ04_9PASS|nr:hypothetical protein WISP_04707 [Willisornis vidua]